MLILEGLLTQYPASLTASLPRYLDSSEDQRYSTCRFKKAKESSMLSCVSRNGVETLSPATKRRLVSEALDSDKFKRVKPSPSPGTLEFHLLDEVLTRLAKEKQVSQTSMDMALAVRSARCVACSS